MDSYNIDLSAENDEREIFLNITENGENLDVTTEDYTPVGVTSVNGKKGKVILTTSDLENTSDYQTESEVRAKITQAVEQHNSNAQAHPAIRNTINGKQDKLVSGTTIKTINNESILGSGNLDIQGGTEDYNELTNKPVIAHSTTSVSNRIVTVNTTNTTIQSTQNVDAYIGFNFIPLDMSSYTSGAANKALLPKTHLPYGVYIVTNPGYMRLGTDQKKLEVGTLVYWYDSGDLYLIGYNACEYWSYDSKNDEWSGGYFTTTDDVDYAIEEKIGWQVNNSALVGGTATMTDGRWSRRTRATGINSLTITFPKEIPGYNYKSKVTCKTSSAFTTFNVAARDYNIYFYGDDCVDGVLTGVANKYYEMEASHDGFEGLLVKVISHTLPSS